MPEPARPSIRTGRVARAAPLVALTGRTAGEAVISALRRKDRTQSTARSAERYAESLGQSRGVLMKAGQTLPSPPGGSVVEGQGGWVSRPALARPQDAPPPMDPEVAAGVVKEELGAAPLEVFAEFEPMP